MKITNNPNIYTKSPFFASNARTLVRNGKTLNGNITEFFRSDLNWREFTDKLIDKYKDIDKVNVHCFACSDGSEPFSLAMMLVSKLGEKGAQKFFPIMASDRDAYILKSAKKGIGEMTFRDFANLDNFTGKDCEEFLTEIGEMRMHNGKMVTPVRFKDCIKNAVIFKKAKIKDEIDSINGDNSVVLARNFWPYLKKSDVDVVAEKIWQKQGQNSMLVCGDFDFDSLYASNDFIRRFAMTDINWCYEKDFSFKKHSFESNPEYLRSIFIPKVKN